MRTLITSGLSVRYHPFLTVGDRVEIISGPLSGAQGILVRADDDSSKLVVSVDLMGRSLVVTIEGWSIRKLA